MVVAEFRAQWAHCLQHLLADADVTARLAEEICHHLTSASSPRCRASQVIAVLSPHSVDAALVPRGQAERASAGVV
jgi:hypothetical protein